MANPVSGTEVLGYILLFFLVFGMSATVDINGVLKQLRNSRALCTGVFLQFIVLPFLGFLTVKMLALSNAMGITLLVVTSSPGGSFSNWWCSIFNADLALSVTMTAISTILAVIMLPLNLYIYIPLAFGTDDVDVVDILDFRALTTSLVVVIGAIGLGIYASDKVQHPNFHTLANRFGSFGGISLVILAGIHSSATDGAGLWEREPKYYLGVAMPCVIALFLSNIMSTYSGLKKPERVTSCIECCYQNCGIATSVALSMFQGEERAEAMGVPFFYGMVEFLTIGVYCLAAWKAGWTKAPPRDPFWKVIGTSYEVLLAKEMARTDVEVQLSKSYAESDVEVTDEYQNEPGFAATCLYYCQEPDVDKVVDSSAPSSLTDSPVEVEDPVKDEDVDDGYVNVTLKGYERPLFWKSLGYKLGI